MAAEKPTYDLMLLLDTAAEDSARAKLVADTGRAIEAGGELIGHHDWGVRALAYAIERHTDAEYHLFQFHATPELLASLDRTLQIADGVLRHRIIKLEPGTPPPPSSRPEPPRVTVAGGSASAPRGAPETTSAPAADAPTETGTAPAQAPDASEPAAAPETAADVAPGQSDAEVEAAPASA